MKRIVYLFGGLGNNLFQIANVSKCSRDFRCVNFFLDSSVRKLLGHTDHPNVTHKICKLETLRFHWSLGLVLLDFVVARAISRTFFTVFDTESLQIKPWFCDLIFFGYFQQSNGSEAVAQNLVSSGLLHDRIVEKIKLKSRDRETVLHIRGGDFREQGLSARLESYRDALALLKGTVMLERLHIITDDLDFVSQVLGESPTKDVLPSSAPASEMSVINDFISIAASLYTIVPNSTFSLLAAHIGAAYLPNKKISRVPD